MNENKKRGWIKNALILFLAVMLVLTLFSNTIMNRSLPEVSVSHAESGMISSQIKLNGTVSANAAKQVVFETARVVDTVSVRRGDTVARGDVLAVLVAGESDEIFQQEVELRQLEIEYKRMLLGEADALVSYRRTIEDSQKKLATLTEYMVEYPALEAEQKGYKDAIEVLQASIDTLDESIEELREEIAKYTNVGYSDPDKLEDAIDRAKDDLKDAEKAYTSAQKARTRMQTAYNNANSLYAAAETGYTNAMEARDKAEDALTSAQKKLDTLEDERDRIAEEIDDLEEMIATLEAIAEPTPEQSAALADAKSDLATAKSKLTAAKNKVSDQKAVVEDKKAALTEATEVATEAQEDYNAKAAALGTAYANYQDANAAYNSAKSARDAADAEVERLQGGFEYALLTSRLEEKLAQRKPMVKEQEEATEALAEVEKKMTKTMEECESEKLSLERSIEDAKSAIALAEANGAIEKETDALQLTIKQSEIERKKKEIADLKARATETQLLAPVSGTVSSVGISAGEDVEAGTVAFEITMTEMGYTMQCSVTNAQAARLRVGQEAEVQYYYWGAKPSVRITQIVGDPNSGGKNKLVTFTVEGDVSEGTSLSIVVGGQGSSYDTIVPNSAVREDANGKFILKVTAKSSPLGNRYFAERIDVEVQASDANKSAVSASLSWGDYVITGASVPIEAGMQVRMAGQ